MCLLRDQLLGQNFEAVLPMIVKLTGEAIFQLFEWKRRKQTKPDYLIDFQKLRVPKIRRTPVLDEKNGLAAAGKTSPS